MYSVADLGPVTGGWDDLSQYELMGEGRHRLQLRVEPSPYTPHPAHLQRKQHMKHIETSYSGNQSIKKAYWNFVNNVKDAYLGTGRNHWEGSGNVWFWPGFFFFLL